ncbi:hypothetical protein JKP88DRAFT_236920 [Tribonema minus]|uniref:Nascent polypeptide-associated complex subunit alpha-like UBA domain-containing protein n=1 Tax=Tribonema minus TaxID=303371 RepID=A0A835Z499_9STRA|nr:hypothetical protein JKP88DRAFT_236920 [Tribonema minus]
MDANKEQASLDNLEKATELGEDSGVDAAQTQSALSALGTARDAGKPKSIVKINAADVKYIMEELDTTKEETEAALHACAGDVTKAVKQLLH